MNRDNIITSLLIAIVLVIAGSVVYFGKPPAAADTLVLLKTQGMTCQACSYKITQELTQRKGIAHVAFDVPAGIVEIYFDSHHEAPAKLATTVTNLGFPSTVAYAQPYQTPSCSQATDGAPRQCKNCNKKVVN